MKEEIKVIRSLLESGRLSRKEALELLKAIEKSGEKEIWDTEIFDPWAFVITEQETFSLQRTLIDDIVKAEIERSELEILETIRLLRDDQRREQILHELSKRPSIPEDLGEGSLSEGITALHGLSPIPLLWAVEELKSLEKFKDFEVVREFSISEVLERLKEESVLPSAEARKGFRVPVEGVKGIVFYNTFPAAVECIGIDGDDVFLEATKISWASDEDDARAQAEEIEISFQREGESLWILDERLDHRMNRKSFLRMKLCVPKRIDLSIQNNRGGIHIEGIDGKILTRSLFGPIVAKDLNGELGFGTYVGDVTVSNATGKIYGKSLAGVIKLENTRGEVKIRNMAGLTSLHSVSGPITLLSSSGSFKLRDICTSDLELLTVKGDIELEGTLLPGGSYFVRSRDGNISLKLSPHSDVGLSARTEHGEVRLSLPSPIADMGYVEGLRNVAGANIRRGSGRLEAMSITGNITVELMDSGHL